jgi:hypothetical protein
MGLDETESQPELRLKTPARVLLTNNVLAESCLSGYYPINPGEQHQKLAPA